MTCNMYTRTATYKARPVHASELPFIYAPLYFSHRLFCCGKESFVHVKSPFFGGKGPKVIYVYMLGARLGL